MPRLSLLAEGSAPVPFKPFNDCLLSLKGGANFKGKVTPAIEKSKKILKIQYFFALAHSNLYGYENSEILEILIG